MVSANIAAETSVTKKNVVDASAEVTHLAGGNAFYLKGLNGLRAIAAISVVITHIIQANTGILLFLGGFSVTIFFTLSGFLITLLMLKEIGQTGTISIGNFYKRRALRIWPLYYLYLFICISVNPLMGQAVHPGQLLCYVLFAPNISFITANFIRLAGHYWSLGVEEQFYLVWPVSILFFRKRLARFFAAFILSFLIAKTFLHSYYGYNSLPYMFIYYCRFDCMAIGGAAAYLYFTNVRGLFVARYKIFQIIAWFVLLLVWIGKFHFFRVYDQEILSVATAILIINQVSNPRNIISLENKVFNFFGKISYGIYIIHPMVIAVVLATFKREAKPPSIIIDGPVIFVSTILLAYLSYNFFESYFLKLKDRPLKKASFLTNAG